MRRYRAVLQNINFVVSIGGGGTVVALETFWAGLPILWKGVIVAGVMLLALEAARILEPKRQKKGEQKKGDVALDINALVASDDAADLRSQAIAVEGDRLKLESQKQEHRYYLSVLAMWIVAGLLFSLLLAWCAQDMPARQRAEPQEQPSVNNGKSPG